MRGDVWAFSCLKSHLSMAIQKMIVPIPIVNAMADFKLGSKKNHITM